MAFAMSLVEIGQKISNFSFKAKTCCCFLKKEAKINYMFIVFIYAK